MQKIQVHKNYKLYVYHTVQIRSQKQVVHKRKPTI